jgi:hypothetical protein
MRINEHVQLLGSRLRLEKDDSIRNGSTLAKSLSDRRNNGVGVRV